MTTPDNARAEADADQRLIERVAWIAEQLFNGEWVPVFSDRHRAAVDAWLSIQDTGEYRVVPAVPDTARAEADADPPATLAALRKTWGARERRLSDQLDRYGSLSPEHVRGQLYAVQELLDFIGR